VSLDHAERLIAQERGDGTPGDVAAARVRIDADTTGERPPVDRSPVIRHPFMIAGISVPATMRPRACSRRWTSSFSSGWLRQCADVSRVVRVMVSGR
jgi:hypothetical protein